jgi:putative ATP-dependent endonuclease of the OLD family
MTEMFITKVVIENYRTLRKSTIQFNDKLNVIVGDNETGKSTLLEALNLALSGQLNGRSILYELHPYLFNLSSVSEYIDNLNKGLNPQPPKITIEVYLNDNIALSKLVGTNNSLRENAAGISLTIEYDDAFSTEYASYIKDPQEIRTVPVEYFAVHWRSFSGANITARSIPLKPTFIDASALRNNLAANKYIVDIMNDHLTPAQRAELSLSYRKMKDHFVDDPHVKAVNTNLKTNKGHISNKTLSVALDTTSRGSWENGIMPQLDEIPLSLVGRGEQSSIKVKLAMAASHEAHVFLIEEIENHLSYSNLSKLLDGLSKHAGERQMIVTTHSSFVLNKLGVERVLLFNGSKSLTLKNLSPETHDYFMKLPGHDTLRLILTSRAILVEGPSDELIVQKAYLKKHGVMPLAHGIDVISVSSLAFKRFLEIAEPLGIQVNVVTDNDGDVTKLEKKYAAYSGNSKIKINYDLDTTYRTLEPQLLKVNGLKTLNEVFGTDFNSESELINYMTANKTDCALMIFNSDAEIKFPQYIEDAIN